MLDGTILPITPITAWTTGRFKPDARHGRNVQDEQNFSISIGGIFAQPQAPITEAQYTPTSRRCTPGRIFGRPEISRRPRWNKVLAEYPPNLAICRPRKVYDLVGTPSGSLPDVQVDRLWAGGSRCTNMNSTISTRRTTSRVCPAFQPAAAHTIDIQFLFRNCMAGCLA